VKPSVVDPGSVNTGNPPRKPPSPIQLPHYLGTSSSCYTAHNAWRLQYHSLEITGNARMVLANEEMGDAQIEPHQSKTSSHARQAACLNCRRSKIRCNRTEGNTACDKCRQASLDCVVPSHHVGRQKGVKKSVSLRYPTPQCLVIHADTSQQTQRAGEGPPPDRAGY
jgi:hypothetical protein